MIILWLPRLAFFMAAQLQTISAPLRRSLTTMLRSARWIRLTPTRLFSGHGTISISVMPIPAGIGSLAVIYGITANNNPSVQDPWNTTPAWGFPYAASNVAPGPAAATLVDGTYAGHVGGVGAYAFINNLVYLELTGYRTLGFQDAAQFGSRPIWRLAVPKRGAILASGN